MRNPPFDDVARSISYDPETGVFVWLPRNDLGKDQNRWNTRYAGGPAGNRASNGYHVIRFRGVHYKAHRIAWLLMTGEWPADQIDHRDLNRSNNRWSNLRAASAGQNVINRRLQSNNSSGRRGVVFNRQRRKWQVQIGANGKLHYLGCFESKEEAAATYLAAAKIHFGEFCPDDGMYVRVERAAIE
jgi:hypothetical protein